MVPGGKQDWIFERKSLHQGVFSSQTNWAVSVEIILLIPTSLSYIMTVTVLWDQNYFHFTDKEIETLCNFHRILFLVIVHFPFFVFICDMSSTRS